MKKFFYSFEVPLVAYLLLVMVFVIIQRAPGVWGFLGFHFLGLLILFSVAWVEQKYQRRFWTVLRHWLPILFIVAIFRELTFLIPQIHPFDSYYWDGVLASWDQALFGDVHQKVSHFWSPFLIELFYYCYWFYFPMPLILALLFWWRKSKERYRHFGTVYFVTMLLGYLLYMLIPAVGPQHFESRPSVLDGVWFGEWMHLTLRELEMTTADAFPSLHTAAAVLVLVYSWGTHRKYFWWMLLPGVGLVLSTMVLRYHYIVDVLAGILLVPVGLYLGDRLHRYISGEKIKESS